MIVTVIRRLNVTVTITQVVAESANLLLRTLHVNVNTWELGPVQGR